VVQLDQRTKLGVLARQLAVLVDVPGHFAVRQHAVEFVEPPGQMFQFVTNTLVHQILAFSR